MNAARESSLTPSAGAQRPRQIAACLAEILQLYDRDPQLAELCTGALCVQDDDCRCSFGPSEISLSFSQARAPAIRCLAEVTNACVPPFPNVTVRNVAERIIHQLGAPATHYDIALLHSLTDVAYSGHSTKHLRFGAAVELSHTPSMGLKCYFDLHTDGRELAAARLEAALHCLSLAPQLAQAKQLLGARFTEGRCHGLSASLTVGERPGVCLYTSGARWTLRELREALRTIGRDDQLGLLHAFNQEVLGGVDSGEPLSNLLVAFVFSPAAGAEPILKLDAFMPALKPDDLSSYQAFFSLARQLGIAEMEPHAELFGIATKTERLSESQRVVHYLSLDFLQPPVTKLNAYFRTSGTETEHMTTSARPRRKPRLLAQLDNSCRRAIMSLEREHSTHYSEAMHRMVFPEAAGFSSARELHIGDVFQRALIASSLLDARQAGYQLDAKILADDVSQLIGMRSGDGLRGWKYFPSLPELPPDVDDLAQVVQVLKRVEHPDIGTLVDPLLEIIEANYHPDGSFETWIVDPADESQTTELIRAFIQACWGTGPDPEVVANMLYSLSIYANERFKGHISDTIRYLASRQRMDGSWSATWYAGPFYPTFVCSRAIQIVDPSHYALYRAEKFLTSSQHSQGGWGPNEPNSGDSAYALRTVSLFKTEGARQMLLPACRYLLEQQEQDGFWRAADFIRMDTSRGSEGVARGDVLIYRSRILTTAACLGALCAARPLIDDG
jgi:hypothetical protein